jgi:hypothetical protein
LGEDTTLSQPIPEPASLTLLGMGFVSAAFALGNRRRRGSFEIKAAEVA